MDEKEQRVSSGAQQAAVVVGSGQSSVDYLCVVARHPRLDGKQALLHYEIQPGGQVPTALVALRRWGLPVAYVGAFGDDPGGILVRSALAREGVDLRGSVVMRNECQPVSVILIDRTTGERSVLAAPASPGMALPEIPREVLIGSRYLLLDAVSVSQATEAARKAKSVGVRVMLDIDRPAPGIEELLRLTDVLIAAREFYCELTGEENVRRALRKAAAYGPRLVGMTLGTGGAAAMADGKTVFVPAFRVPAVDTTGAGDVFHAGCLYGLLSNWPLEKILRFAAACAALKCRELGGRPGIPRLEEVGQFLGEHLAQEEALSRRHGVGGRR
jgi:sugar/nucleoside kinase (ribokinase family)